MTLEPVLSIIVVSWKVRDHLSGCLASVHDDAAPAGGGREILVVDNDSRDGTVDMVRGRFPSVTLIANADNRGFGRACNQAFAHSRGRFVLLLNPDAEVRPGAIRRMLEWMEARPEVAILGCRLENPDGSTRLAWAAGWFPTLWRAACHWLFLRHLLPAGWRPRPLVFDGDPEGDLDVDWVSGACMLLRRDALEGRLFHEGFFMYGEDMELCDRVRRRGWRVVYSTCASVVHHHGMSRAQSPRARLHLLRGPRLFLSLRHRRPWLLAYDLIIAAGFVLRFVGFSALAVLRPGRGYGARARLAGGYLGLSLRILLAFR